MYKTQVLNGIFLSGKIGGGGEEGGGWVGKRFEILGYEVKGALKNSGLSFCQ